MQNLSINQLHTDVSIPRVEFNAETGHCLLAGEAYMEQPYVFYKPLYEWLNTYIKEVKQPIFFEIRLTYFNTSSSKFVLDILRILKRYEIEGGEVRLQWYLRAIDEDMREEIEDFALTSGLHIYVVDV